jgi:uncharacterized delta-60 repeat protein
MKFTSKMLSKKFLQIATVTSLLVVGGFGCNSETPIVVSTPTPSATPVPTATPATSRAEIFVGGTFSTYAGNSLPRLGAFLTDGTQDSSYSVTGTGLSSTVRWLIPMGTKVLAGGAFANYNGNTAINRIARFNADGSLDTSFATTGTGFNSTVYSMTLDSNGKIMVAGAFATYNGTTVNHLARLNTDGSLDTTFAMAGTGLNYQVNTVVFDSAGRILVGGYNTGYNGTNSNYIARLNADGSLDTAFTANVGTGFNNEVQQILVTASGQYVVVGEFTTYNGAAAPYLARLNSDGTLDTTFNSGGAGLSAAAWKMALDSSGRVIVGGDFTTYNGVAASHIVRINTNGSLDTSFVSGSGLNGDAYGVTIQSDGKLLIGGTFGTYNGATAVNLMRLNTDGSLDTTFATPASAFNNYVTRIIVLNVPI